MLCWLNVSIMHITDEGRRMRFVDAVTKMVELPPLSDDEITLSTALKELNIFSD